MKIFENKKSQAAVEFLITYGWVILGVLVVVGALAYFGVFNTDRFVNDECSFGTQLYCEDFILMSSPNDLKMVFRNNFGQAVDLTGVTVLYEGEDLRFVANGYGVVNPGETRELDLSNSWMTFSKNDKVKLSTVLFFKRSVINSPTHNITGTIIATAQ